VLHKLKSQGLPFTSSSTLPPYVKLLMVPLYENTSIFNRLDSTKCKIIWFC